VHAHRALFRAADASARQRVSGSLGGGHILKSRGRLARDSAQRAIDRLGSLVSDGNLLAAGDPGRRQSDQPGDRTRGQRPTSDAHGTSFFLCHGWNQTLRTSTGERRRHVQAVSVGASMSLGLFAIRRRGAA
jgi:hypothetical protein